MNNFSLLVATADPAVREQPSDGPALEQRTHAMCNHQNADYNRMQLSSHCSSPPSSSSSKIEDYQRTPLNSAASPDKAEKEEPLRSCSTIFLNDSNDVAAAATPATVEHRRLSRRLQEKTALHSSLSRLLSENEPLTSSVPNHLANLKPNETEPSLLLSPAVGGSSADTPVLQPDILANILFAYNLRVALNPPEDRQIPSNPYSLFGVGEKGTKRVGIWKRVPDMYSFLGLQAAPEAFNRRCRYVGLRNLGATCYMNCYLQTLYMNPDFRYRLFAVQPRSLLNSSNSSVSEGQLDVVAELQQLFAALQSGTAQTADPSGVARALRISTDYQEDATEFATLLLMTLERQLGGSRSQQNFVPELFRGRQTQRMICEACGTVSTRTDDFYEIRVQVPSSGGPQPQKSPELSKQNLSPLSSRHSAQNTKSRSKKRIKSAAQSKALSAQNLSSECDSTTDAGLSFSPTSLDGKNCSGSSRLSLPPSDDVLVEPPSQSEVTGADDVNDSSDAADSDVVDQRQTVLSDSCSPRSKAFHLEAGLARAFQSERLRGDNRYMCNTCGKKVDAERQIFFASLPPYLHICFERYAYEEGGRKKLTTLVDYPLSLNLRQFREPVVPSKTCDETLSVCPPEKDGASSPIREAVTELEDLDDDPDEYELIGILQHQGSSASTGHYVAHLRDVENCSVLSANAKRETGTPFLSPHDLSRLSTKQLKKGSPKLPLSVGGRKSSKPTSAFATAAPQIISGNVYSDARDTSSILPLASEETLCKTGSNTQDTFSSGKTRKRASVATAAPAKRGAAKGKVTDQTEEKKRRREGAADNECLLLTNEVVKADPLVAHQAIASTTANGKFKATSPPTAVLKLEESDASKLSSPKLKSISRVDNVPTPTPISASSMDAAAQPCDADLHRPKPAGHMSPDLVNVQFNTRKKPRYHPNHPKIVEAPGAHRTISHKGRSHNIQSSLISGGGTPLTVGMSAAPCGPVYPSPFWPDSPHRAAVFSPPLTPEYLMYPPAVPPNSMPTAPVSSLPPADFSDFSSFYFLRAAAAAAAAATSHFNLFPPMMPFPLSLPTIGPATSPNAAAPSHCFSPFARPPLFPSQVNCSMAFVSKQETPLTAGVPPSQTPSFSYISPSAASSTSTPQLSPHGYALSPSGPSSCPPPPTKVAVPDAPGFSQTKAAVSSNLYGRETGSPPIVSSQAPAEETATLLMSPVVSVSSGQVTKSGTENPSSTTPPFVPDTSSSKTDKVACHSTAQNAALVIESRGCGENEMTMCSAAQQSENQDHVSCRTRDAFSSPSRTKIVGWVTTARPSASSDCFVASESLPNNGTDIGSRVDEDRGYTADYEATRTAAQFNDLNDIPCDNNNGNVTEHRSATKNGFPSPPIGHYQASDSNGTSTWRAPREGLLGGRPVALDANRDKPDHLKSDASPKNTNSGSNASIEADVLADKVCESSALSEVKLSSLPGKVENELRVIETPDVSQVGSELGALATGNGCAEKSDALFVAQPQHTRLLRNRNRVTTPESAPSPASLTVHSAPRRKSRSEPSGVDGNSLVDQKWAWIQFDDAMVSEWKIQSHCFHRDFDSIPGWKGKVEKSRLSSRSAYLVIYKRKNWRPATAPAYDSSAGSLSPSSVSPKIAPLMPSSGAHSGSLSEVLDSFIVRRRSEVLGRIRDSICTLQEQYKNWKTKFYTVSNEWSLFQYCLNSMAFVPMSWWAAFICGIDYASLATSLPAELRPVRSPLHRNVAIWNRAAGAGRNEEPFRCGRKHLSAPNGKLNDLQPQGLVLYNDILCPHYLRALESGACDSGHWGSVSVHTTKNENATLCDEEREEQSCYSAELRLGSSQYGIDPLAIWDGKAKLVPEVVLREIFTAYNIVANIPRVAFTDSVCMDCCNGYSQLVEYWFEQRACFNDLKRFVRSYDVLYVDRVNPVDDSSQRKGNKLQSLGNVENQSSEKMTAKLLEDGEILCWVSRRVLMDLDGRFSARDKTRKLPEGVYTLYNAADDARRELHRLREAMHKNKPPTSGTQTSELSATSSSGAAVCESDRLDDSVCRSSCASSCSKACQLTLCDPSGDDTEEQLSSRPCKLLSDDSTGGRQGMSDAKHDLVAGVVCSHKKLLPDKKAYSRVLVPKSKVERFLNVEEQRLSLLKTQFLLDAEVIDRTRIFVSAWVDVKTWDVDPATLGSAQRNPVICLGSTEDSNCEICEYMLVQERRKAAEWRKKVEDERASVGDCVYRRVCKLTKLQDARRNAPYCLAEGRHYLIPADWLDRYFSYLSARDEELGVPPGAIDGRVLLTHCDCDNSSTQQPRLVHDPVSYLDTVHGVALHPKDNAKHPESDIYVLTHFTEFEPLAERYGFSDVPYITVTFSPLVATDMVIPLVSEEAEDSAPFAEELDEPKPLAPAASSGAVMSVQYAYSVPPCLTCVQARRFSPGGVGDFSDVTLRLRIEGAKITLGRQASRRQLFTVSGDTRVIKLIDQVVVALNLNIEIVASEKLQLFLEGPAMPPLYDVKRVVLPPHEVKGSASVLQTLAGTPSAFKGSSLYTQRPQPAVVTPLWCHLPLTLVGSPVTLRDFHTKIDTRWCIRVTDGEGALTS